MKKILEIESGKAYIDTSVAINITAALNIPLESIVLDCPPYAKNLRDEELLPFVESPRKYKIKKNICPVCESKCIQDEYWDEDKESSIGVKFCPNCNWGFAIELKTGKRVMC
jgi:hypothetical protein